MEQGKKTMEMDFFRRSCCTSRIERVRNEEIWGNIGVSIGILDTALTGMDT